MKPEKEKSSEYANMKFPRTLTIAFLSLALFSLNIARPDNYTPRCVMKRKQPLQHKNAFSAYVQLNMLSQKNTLLTLQN